MKISTVVINAQIEESGRAVVQDVETHHCAVARHQARHRQHLRYKSMKMYESDNPPTQSCVESWSRKSPVTDLNL